MEEDAATAGEERGRPVGGLTEWWGGEEEGEEAEGEEDGEAEEEGREEAAGEAVKDEGVDDDRGENAEEGGAGAAGWSPEEDTSARSLPRMDATAGRLSLVSAEELVREAALTEVDASAVPFKTADSCWLGGGDRVRTTFRRPGRGRNLGGSDSHVFRPITTALRRGNREAMDSSSDGYVVVVTSRKNWKSLLSLGHGKVPLRPMPISSVAATTIWKERIPGCSSLGESSRWPRVHLFRRISVGISDDIARRTVE